MGANSWTKSGSGVWSTGADWSSGSVPGAATDVLLGGSLAETLVLASGTDAIVHSLTLTDAAATISLAGATLTTSGGVFAAGTVDRAGTLASTGPVALSGLVLGGGAVWANQGAATLTGTLALGDITGGAATIANGGSLFLAADAAGISGNIYLDANATTELGSGLLLNTGLLEKTAGTGTSDSARAAVQVASLLCKAIVAACATASAIT